MHFLRTAMGTNMPIPLNHTPHFSHSLVSNRLQAVPCNNRHAQKRAHTTKHQRDNAPRREPSRQRRRRRILALEIKQIRRVARRIARRRNRLRLASAEVVLRNRHVRLQGERRLDHRRYQPRRRVPLDVAVEEPDSRVVGPEPDHVVAERPHQEDVAAHGDRGELVLGRVGGVVGARVVETAGDRLEVVAVEVEGMLVRVEVVEHNLDHVVAIEDEGVAVGAIDLGRGGCGAGSKGGVETGDVGWNVADIIDECAV